MQNDVIEEFEETPKLNSKKCKFISFIIAFALKYTIVIATLITWYLYDYFIALLALTLSFIIIGIIRSKIRNSSIPTKQREFTYTDQEIADWFTKKEFCPDASSLSISL